MHTIDKCNLMTSVLIDMRYINGKLYANGIIIIIIIENNKKGKRKERTSARQNDVTYI